MSESISDSGTTSAAPAEYRVLARKYRPSDFSTLIGQDALVRTLSNAIRSGRLAQAYILTGVRGVGKTTTARIIARALNCIGPDGTGGPTVDPCGVCDHCRAISEDRHVDVLEMDAASRTGVGDMRDILESVRYRPTSARYKIYIIDEVHMLSNQAFNALLKTLEEPPEHVKFIFATTEIRKVPVTVLSRCQRFDLRRVSAELLSEHFRRIVEHEGANIEDGALKMLARAADGSVRDGLSLLDQAIAHGSGTVSEQQVRDMLGLADRGVVFDLFDAVMKGDLREALKLLGDQYAAGADPVVVLGDMLELTHWLTRLKVTPEDADNPMAGESERTRGKEMAAGLSVGVLTRTWQMLLKGVAEARQASAPLQAVEMCLVRLAYAADLPTPAEAIAKMQGGQPLPRPSSGPAAPAAAPTGSQTAAVSSPPPSAAPAVPPNAPSARVAGGPPVAAPAHQVQEQEQTQPQQAPQARAEAPNVPKTFEKLVAMFKAKREAVLAVHLEKDVHLVRYDPAAVRLEFRPGANAPQDLAGKLGKCLSEWTGLRWGVLISNEPGDPTLLEKSLTGAQAHPLVQEVLKHFPNATIGTIRDLEPEDGGNDLTLPDLGILPPTELDDISEADDLNGDDEL